LKKRTINMNETLEKMKAEIAAKLKPVRCIRCNRWLTDPESIARKLGPLCAQEIDAANAEYHAQKALLPGENDSVEE
jgi:uncharacterized protein DUF6011